MSAQPTKTLAEKAAEYGLKADEYDVIIKRLNREPNDVELGVFSVMWSEHCSLQVQQDPPRQIPDVGAQGDLRSGRERRGHRHRRW